jgi:hypothetical protein
MSDESYYTILGISETATQDEIERVYRRIAGAYHVLSDSIQRSRYDQQLVQQRAVFLLPTAPPEAAATPPLDCHSSLPAYPVKYSRWPSAEPQPQAGESDSVWRNLAPWTGVLLLLAFPLSMLFVFDSRFGRLGVLLLTVPALICCLSYLGSFLSRRARQVEQARLRHHHHLR